MSISKKHLNNPLSNLGPLFDSPIIEGSMDVGLKFRDILSKAFGRCKDSRYQLAGKLSEVTGRNISKDMLDKYTSSNFDYALRAEDLPGVILITQSLEVAQVLVEPVGCLVASPEDSKLLKLARLNKEKNKILSEIAALETQIGLKTK